MMAPAEAIAPARRGAKVDEPTAAGALAADLRGLAVAALGRMYDPKESLFVFRLRRSGDRVISEGLSSRYTAISIIGLAADSPATAAIALNGQALEVPCARLVRDCRSMTNLGDVALTLWALGAARQPNRAVVLDRLRALDPVDRPVPTVELAWTLSALALMDGRETLDLRVAVRNRLVKAFNPHARVFPHVVGTGPGMRSHVACFADQVYPIQALALLAQATGDREALQISTTAARHICEAQGEAGQWWWHYDSRTGRIIEGYPVYAVHQDSMAPMALLAVTAAGGPSFAAAIDRGFEWLAHAPELAGGSLIDRPAGLIWRKVARREPGRLSRYVQASATAVHPRLRAPGLNALFPPVAIDYEDRPYHLGWLLLTCRQLQEQVRG